MRRNVKGSSNLQLEIGRLQWNVPSLPFIALIVTLNTPVDGNTCEVEEDKAPGSEGEGGVTTGEGLATLHDRVNVSGAVEIIGAELLGRRHTSGPEAEI